MKESLPAYTLVRSSRRTVAVQVLPGAQVVVRAPRDISDRRVRQIMAQHQEAIRRHMRAMALVAPPRVLSAEEVSALYLRARSVLPAKVSYYAALLGQRFCGFTVTGAKKRFGSCSSRGSLCFSYLLMRYPEAAVHYVVLHEVAHLIHPNHSPAFYQTIARYMPDYRAREALLKQSPDKA